MYLHTVSIKNQNNYVAYYVKALFVKRYGTETSLDSLRVKLYFEILELKSAL